MKALSARDPRHNGRGGIDLYVTFEGLGELPFTARMDDTEQHGRELYALAMAGSFGEVADYEAPVVPLATLAANKRAAVQRGKKIARDGGFWHEGVKWDSDTEARIAYAELALQYSMDQTFTKRWKASSGNWVEMTFALFLAMKPVYQAHLEACFAWQDERDAEIDAALAMVAPILDEEDNPTGEYDETAARAALAAIAETK